MTDELRNLLKDVQTVYEGKGMVVHPNSCDKLRMEVIKLDNINKQQSEQIEKMKCCQNCKHSDIGCQGHTICGIGHFFDCLSNNNFFNHQTSDVDYWEIKEK